LQQSPDEWNEFLDQLPNGIGNLVNDDLDIVIPASVINTTGALGKAIGTARNQHLTLLGGVTSDSYIEDLNRGLGDMEYDPNTGVLNGQAPAWATDTSLVTIGELELP